MTADDILTGVDLPTLRRMVAHYRARARYRGLVGATVCHALAKTCERMIDVIERHGAQRPEVDYHELDKLRAT